jgi:hypothetical protein
MIVVRAFRVLALLFLVVAFGAATMPSGQAAASCATFDADNIPTTAFRGGDEIVVRGTGFGPNSIVIVNLQQGTRTIDLARVSANDLGAFRLDDGIIPESVIAGEAAIRALDARGSATCPLTLSPGKEKESSLGGLFLVWGVLLVVFAGVLVMLTYRRWKAEQLREAVDSLAWREQYEERVTAKRGAVVPGARDIASITDDDLAPEDLPLRRILDRPASLGIDEPIAELDRADERYAPPPRPAPISIDALTRFQRSDEDDAAPPISRREAFFDDDDDLYAIGAPRPFDDRFTVSDDGVPLPPVREDDRRAMASRPPRAPEPVPEIATSGEPEDDAFARALREFLDEEDLEFDVPELDADGELDTGADPGPAPVRLVADAIDDDEAPAPRVPAVELGTVADRSILDTDPFLTEPSSGPARTPEPEPPTERSGRAPEPALPEPAPSEPPVLPVGWDGGRLRPHRSASDAITRLRREVRSWRR